MRALIYDPYLDTAGGGERYMLTAAAVLSRHGYKVDVWWKDKKIASWLQTRLGIDFSGITFIDALNHGLGYDLVFWLSDGSLPLLMVRKNVVHFQTPFKNIGGRTLFNRLKKVKIDEVVCNSNFTKSVIDKEFNVASRVVYPPVNTDFFLSCKKENIILYVGRYSQLQQLKRQDVLVEAFCKMLEQGLKGWRLMLIGGSEIGGREYVKTLKNMSQGHPIDILENLPLDKVQKAYGKAKIFWSASGFGVDSQRDPQQVEHFGMSVVEAMSAECVPVVVDQGGHKEILKDNDNGFLWNSFDELTGKTLQLIKDERRRIKLAKEAKKTSKKFSIAEFERSILKVFEG